MAEWADELDDDTLCRVIVAQMFSEGTKEMAIRTMELCDKPTPEQIETAAPWFHASWKAVAVLAGWVPTAEGGWLNIDEAPAPWEQKYPLRPDDRMRYATHKWNPELGALGIQRLVRGYGRDDLSWMVLGYLRKPDARFY